MTSRFDILFITKEAVKQLAKLIYRCTPERAVPNRAATVRLTPEAVDRKIFHIRSKNQVSSKSPAA
jgi:hypothetical protein